MPFTKSHALGNDYIILEENALPFQLTEKNIRFLCDRNRGIGSDGILLLTTTDKADFGLRIFNPDGSEAEKSGNGIRMFAKYLYEHGHADKKAFTIDTKGGIVTATVKAEHDRVTEITVDMGTATFTSSDIPVTGQQREVIAEPLRVADKTYKVTCASVGNPHCVIFTDTLDGAELRKYGPLIERHAAFPNRINVQFAKVVSPKEVRILIWERGAGETSASGSSSCAVACAAKKNGLTGNDVTIQSPGGNLRIELDDNYRICMTGPASEVANGEFSKEFLALLNAHSP